MWIYRNSRTGQVAERPARSSRLDALPNWQLIGSPPEEEPDPTGVGRMLPDESAGGAAPAAGVDLAAMVAAALQAAGPPTLLPRPPDSAPKAVWVAYAVARGATEADARALSKASLIEEYGGDDGEN
jgi:hypothetical protein